MKSRQKEKIKNTVSPLKKNLNGLDLKLPIVKYFFKPKK